MNTILFEHCGVAYDVPVSWRTYEWWLWQGLDEKEARKAQKSFRQYIIEMETPDDIDQAREEMHNLRTEIIQKTIEYLQKLYSLSDEKHEEYKLTMSMLREQHNEKAMICSGSLL